MHTDLPEIDARCTTYRRGDQTYTLPAYDNLEAWQARAELLREHLACVLGLYPMPDLVPLEARVVARQTLDDHMVENVYLLGPAGLICTGNLYRPTQTQAPAPAILNPHGHWQHGRLEHSDAGSVRARCITFARMGMLAFSYDMVGYNDSLQLPQHRFATARGALWGLTPIALQTYNSLLALDWLCTLDFVDSNRIGCTGASGGASQALFLLALDERVRAVASVNMISAHFQGGCVCENQPGLRIYTNNLEIAALTAPRPMLMVSATGDWTSHSPTVEFPALQAIYRLYGAEDQLEHVHIDAGHNYNAESRAAVYKWFARHFSEQAPQSEIRERSFPILADEELRVFPDGELPKEIPGPDAMPQRWRARARKRLDALCPHDLPSLDRFREISRTRLRHVLGLDLGDLENVTAERGQDETGEGVTAASVALGRPGHRERIAARLYMPEGMQTPAGSALLLDAAGFDAFESEIGQPSGLVFRLVHKGYQVLVLEPFYRHPPEGAQVRRDHNWFWSTFNPPLLGEQVQDILVALSYLAGLERDPVVIGRVYGGAWAMLAAAMTDMPLRIAADLTTIAIDADETYFGSLFAPLLRAHGDLRITPALVAPRPMLLAVRPDQLPPEWTKRPYQLLKAESQLALVEGHMTDSSILEWGHLDGKY